MDSNVLDFVSNYGANNELENLLQQLIRETALTQVNNAQMASDIYQARLLNCLVKITKSKNILEIGTFTGVSTIAMAAALHEDGKIITIERNDELEWISTKYFNLSKLNNKITQLFGSAIDIIPNLDEKFDLIFIDGDKREYTDYYNLSLTKLNPDGLIIADNVLWYNKIFEKNNPKDKMTSAICDFLQIVENDKSVQKIILPIRDGLLLLKKI